MAGGFVGLFGLAGSPSSSETPAEAGFIQWDLWTWAGLAIESTEIGATAVREDRSDNRLYLRTERLSQTTARPGDLMFSAVRSKTGWLVCDGASTVGSDDSGATYAGEQYHDLWDAITTSGNWDDGDTVTLPTNPLSGDGLNLFIKL